MNRILRYEVPVDDQWHLFRAGEPLHVACRDTEVVEFWAWETADGTLAYREFLVVGTGHYVEEGVRHIGTALVPGGGLVWHLVMR